MSKGGPASPPPAIDPVALGDQQLKANTSTAFLTSALNNINTSSPYGSSMFTLRDPNDPSKGYDLSQTLSPELKSLFGNQIGLADAAAGDARGNLGAGGNFLRAGNTLEGQVLNLASQLPGKLDLRGVPDIQSRVNIPGGIQGGLDFSGLRRLPSISTDFSGEVKKAQDAAYDAQMGYLRPQQQQESSNLAQSLADRGIQLGTDAYDRAQGNLSRAHTFGNQQALDAAVAAGNQEQSTLFGEGLGAFGADLQARQQGANEVSTAGNFANSAQAQDAAQQIAAGDFANRAHQVGFGEAQQIYQNPLAQFQALGQAASGAAGLGFGSLGSVLPAANYTQTGTVPTYGGSPTNVSPANIVGAGQVASQSAQNNFTAQNTLNNQFWNGLGSLGSAVFGGGGGGGGGALASIFSLFA